MAPKRTRLQKADQTAGKRCRNGCVNCKSRGRGARKSCRSAGLQDVPRDERLTRFPRSTHPGHEGAGSCLRPHRCRRWRQAVKATRLQSSVQQMLGCDLRNPCIVGFNVGNSGGRVVVSGSTPHGDDGHTSGLNREGHALVVERGDQAVPRPCPEVGQTPTFCHARLCV